MSNPDPDAIDHYREAETTLEVVEFANGAQTSPSYTEYALAEATLALAYEQRTANLIALAQMEHRNSTGVGFHKDYDSATIHERLDLA